MFNSFCFYLNLIRLSWLAALLRFLVAAFTPFKTKQYGRDVGGYSGWIESPLGPVAFIKVDGSTQWRW